LRNFHQFSIYDAIIMQCFYNLPIKAKTFMYCASLLLSKYVIQGVV